MVDTLHDKLVELGERFALKYPGAVLMVRVDGRCVVPPACVEAAGRWTGALQPDGDTMVCAEDELELVLRQLILAGVRVAVTSGTGGGHV